jgi:hypothetical protein
MRFILLLIALSWGMFAVWGFIRSPIRSPDAKFTAAFIVAWPILATTLVLNQPAPLWLSVPIMFGFLPWLMAGPHLSAITRDPAASQPGEFIGIPRGYWTWGGAGALLLGILFNGYA